MYKMCHEPNNISPAESIITFPEVDHIPLTTRRGLLQPRERVFQQSNIDSVVKREDDCCFSKLGIMSNCGALESEIEEVTRSDALEHLTLKERRKMLMERMVLRLPESNLEDNTKDSYETDLHKIKAEISYENGMIASSSGVKFNGFLEKIDSFLYKKTSIDSESESQLSLSGIQESDIPIAHERSFELSPKASLVELTSRDCEHSPFTSNDYEAMVEKTSNSVKSVKRDPLPLNGSEIQLNQVKVESLDDFVVENNDERNPVTSEKVKVKRDLEQIDDEAHDENELDCANLSHRLNLCKSAPNPSRFVKNEAETASELDEDEIDHMKLIDRLKLRSFHGSGHYEDLNSPTSAFSFSTSDEYVKPLRPWKRKKTATDSIETALEEDAPGLLQVLIQQGVSVDELRLYGEDDVGSDSLDDSVLEESFTELEDVISQLFIKRQTGPKLLNLRLSKASKTSYCVTCLFSLIEQARYLRFRKWPVEWGWCRDLQSFIFVFKRHNRIVMERPEYGYATYFFELSNTASVRWQIKRLVLAMKLASCSRYQLIENKPLLVGEDMTEGEAEVLKKYGWVANTGLGTMLNYRDRVYHDRKSQKETSEWRSKIATLLIDGYNSGTIVSSFIAHDDGVDEDAGLDIGDVKLEPY